MSAEEDATKRAEHHQPQNCQYSRSLRKEYERPQILVTSLRLVTQGGSFAGDSGGAPGPDMNP